MDRDRVFQALRSSTQPGETKVAGDYLNELPKLPVTPAAIPEQPSITSAGEKKRQRARFLTEPCDSTDWKDLGCITDSKLSLRSEEAAEEREARVRALMDRWRAAARRQSRRIRDPWLQYNIDQFPIIRAKRHRYSAIRKTWTQDIVEVKMMETAFANGAIRECFRLKKLSSLSRTNDWKTAGNYVAKKYISEAAPAVLFEDVRLQMDAKLWAEEYNRFSPPKKVDIMQMCVLEMLDLPGNPYYHLEHYIEGPYIKHNGNSGFVNEISRKTPQAFSHFTFERSGHQMIVVDIQGVGDLYTDPQIHTVGGTDYGVGNLGTRGMALFFHSHECNDICHTLGLTEFDLSDAEKRALSYGALTLVSAATKCAPRSLTKSTDSLSYEALVSELDSVDAMECLRRRTLSTMSFGSDSEKKGENINSEGKDTDKDHGDDCTCELCVKNIMAGHELEDEDERGDSAELPDVGDEKPLIRKKAFHTLSNEISDKQLGMRVRVDSWNSSCGESLGSSSGQTGITEKECYMSSAMKKKSVPAGVMSAFQMEELHRVSHKATVLGQIHLDLARYHESGRFRGYEVNDEKKAALGEETGNEVKLKGDDLYDKESALFHLDVARRCGVLEAIVTVAHMAYKNPHELLKDIGFDESWEDPMRENAEEEFDQEAFAFEMMLTAAEMGDRASVLFVAEAYETGRNMGRKGATSYPKAIEWYQKAMGFEDDTNTEGSYKKKYVILAKMAEMYQEGGYGLDQDYDRAYNLYTEAAEVAMEKTEGKLANKYYELAEMCAL